MSGQSRHQKFVPTAIVKDPRRRRICITSKLGNFEGNICEWDYSGSVKHDVKRGHLQIIHQPGNQHKNAITYLISHIRHIPLPYHFFGQLLLSIPFETSSDSGNLRRCDVVHNFGGMSLDEAFFLPCCWTMYILPWSALIVLMLPPHYIVLFLIAGHLQPLWPGESLTLPWEPNLHGQGELKRRWECHRMSRVSTKYNDPVQFCYHIAYLAPAALKMSAIWLSRLVLPWLDWSHMACAESLAIPWSASGVQC